METKKGTTYHCAIIFHSKILGLKVLWEPFLKPQIVPPHLGSPIRQDLASTGTLEFPPLTR